MLGPFGICGVEDAQGDGVGIDACHKNMGEFQALDPMHGGQTYARAHIFGRVTLEVKVFDARVAQGRKIILPDLVIGSGDDANVFQRGPFGQGFDFPPE